MTKKEEYIKKIEESMKKYKDKISKIDSALENYKADNKSDLLAQSENLKEKFEQGEQMLKEIRSATEEKYETIQEKAAEVFESVKEAFNEFSNFLTMEQLSRTKDEIMDLGSEKLEEVQSFIKNHPLTMAAWAMGIGFLVGTLFTRSK